MGVASAPIRYQLQINLVMLKLIKPLDGKKLQIKIKVSLSIHGVVSIEEDSWTGSNCLPVCGQTRYLSG